MNPKRIRHVLGLDIAPLEYTAGSMFGPDETVIEKLGITRSE